MYFLPLWNLTHRKVEGVFVPGRATFSFELWGRIGSLTMTRNTRVDHLTKLGVSVATVRCLKTAVS